MRRGGGLQSPSSTHAGWLEARLKYLRLPSEPPVNKALEVGGFLSIIGRDNHQVPGYKAGELCKNVNFGRTQPAKYTTASI